MLISTGKLTFQPQSCIIDQELIIVVKYLIHFSQKRLQEDSNQYKLFAETHYKSTYEQQQKNTTYAPN